MTIPKWKAYQEEAAEFFRSLGMTAKTDEKVTGVRTNHNVDVLVTSRHAGFESIWIVECKLWRTSVSKNHVLALRAIVSDLGADRGILLSEKGFQRGAVEAAQMTNVLVTTLADARAGASHDVASMRMSDLWVRAESCKNRYWDLPKELRIVMGLRPDVSGYSGRRVIEALREILSSGLRGLYPFEKGDEAYFVSNIPDRFNSSWEVVDCADGLLNDLETKLSRAEAAFKQGPQGANGEWLAPPHQ